MNRDELVSAMRAAAIDVFSTMLGSELIFEHSYVDQGPSRPVDGVVCLIGMAGNWTGTGTIACSAELACRIASQMLLSDYAVVDSDVLDAIAEIANMVLGNVKTVLEQSLGEMAMSIPTAIFGKNFLAKSFGEEAWTVTVFNCGGDPLEVKMFLRPASTPAPAGAGKSCTPVYLRG